MDVIGNLLNRVERNADKLGMVYGYAMPFKANADRWYRGDFIRCFIDQHKQALKLDFDNVQKHLENFLFRWAEGAPFRVGAGAAIAGWLAKEINLDPRLTKLGDAAYRFGWNAVIGSVVAAIIMLLGSPKDPRAPSEGITMRTNLAAINPMEGVYA